MKLERGIQINATIERAKAEDGSRSFPLSFSSDAVLEDNISNRSRLVHTEDAIDMSRAKDGLPLTFGAHKGEIVGRVSDVKLVGNNLRGVATISRSAKGEDVLRDIQDGILMEVSVGASVIEYDIDDDDTVNITRWKPYEVTTGAVVADVSVGINRTAAKTEGKTMTDKTGNTGTGGDNAGESGSVNVVDFKAARETAFAEGQAAERTASAARVTEIERLFAMPAYQGGEFQQLKAELFRTGATVDAARAALLDMVGAGSQPLASDYQQTDTGGSQPAAERTGVVGGGKDQLDLYRDIVGKALEVRVGLTDDKDVVREVRESEFADMKMDGLAREFLRRANVSVGGMRSEQIIGKAMERAIIGHSTSDFANILENTANKSMLLGYDESAEQWDRIARTISVPDFKSNSFVGLSEFGSLPEVKENGEYTYGTFGDRKETAQLATFGQLFSISRQALANDDLDSLGRIPRSMGRAASRTIGDKVFAILTSNPVLNQDSTDLFHANHGNFVAGGSGAAPSVATLNAARTAMATQKDQSSSTTSLNIRGARLVVPVALESTANILMAAEFNPAEGATTSFREPNVHRGTMEVVADARLDDDDAAKWYVTADPNVIDTIGACFLNGQTTPFLETQEKLEVDGLVYKVRIDCVAVALDFRGMYHNDGN